MIRVRRSILVCSVLSLALMGCGTSIEDSVDEDTSSNTHVTTNSSYHGVSDLTKESIEESNRNKSKTNIIISGDRPTSSTDFSLFSAGDAIDYELDKFGGASFESEEGTKISNMLYYRDHDVKQNLLEKPLYSYKDFVEYSLWLDSKLGTDSEFRSGYSELSKTSNLVESTALMDMSFKLNAWEWSITEVENIDNDIRLHIKFTKAPKLNFSSISNSNKLLGVLNAIISDYSDLKVTKISVGSTSDDDFILYLENQIFTIANLHGTVSENGTSSELTIRLYSANAK